MTTQVSILIPTYNRARLLAQTLDGLSRLNVPPGVEVEIVVAANACTDDTEAVVRDVAARLKFPTRCVAEPQLGVNNARNRAVREARFDTLALLDDDVLVEPDWLAGLIDAYTATGADMVCGRVDLWWEAVQRPAWLPQDLEYLLSRLDHGPQVKQIHNTDVVGANFSFTRRVFDAVGPFRPDLDRKGNQLNSGGESFFIATAQARGYHLFYTPNAALKHWVAPNRAKVSYLCKIAAGSSFALVLMKPRFGPGPALWTLGAGGYRILRFGAGSLLARLTGDRAIALRRLVEASRGVGQIKATFTRLWRALSRPPGATARSQPAARGRP